MRNGLITGATQDHIVCALLLMLRDGHLQLMVRADGRRLPPTLFHGPKAKAYLVCDDAFAFLKGPYSEHHIGLMLAKRMPVYDYRIFEQYLTRVLLDPQWMRYYGLTRVHSGTFDTSATHIFLLIILAIVTIVIAF